MCVYIHIIYIHKIISTIPILPKKTLRFRDIKELAPGCSADKAHMGSRVRAVGLRGPGGLPARAQDAEVTSA